MSSLTGSGAREPGYSVDPQPRDRDGYAQTAVPHTAYAGSPLRPNQPLQPPQPQQQQQQATQQAATRNIQQANIGGVQVIGMSAPPHAPSLARKASIPSSSSSPSPSSTPSYYVPDNPLARHTASPFATTRSVIHQSSFSGTSPSPIDSDYEEMAPSSSFGQNLDAASLNARFTPAGSTSTRKTHLAQSSSSSSLGYSASTNNNNSPSMSNRMLAHKDSFGGTQGVGRTTYTHDFSDDSPYNQGGVGAGASNSNSSSSNNNPIRRHEPSRSYSAYTERESDDELRTAGSHSAYEDAETGTVDYRSGSTHLSDLNHSSPTEPIEVLGNTLGRHQAISNSEAAYNRNQSSEKMSSLSAAVAAATLTGDEVSVDVPYQRAQSSSRELARDSARHAMPGSFISDSSVPQSLDARSTEAGRPSPIAAAAAVEGASSTGDNFSAPTSVSAVPTSPEPPSALPIPSRSDLVSSGPSSDSMQDSSTVIQVRSNVSGAQLRPSQSSSTFVNVPSNPTPGATSSTSSRAPQPSSFDVASSRSKSIRVEVSRGASGASGTADSKMSSSSKDRSGRDRDKDRERDRAARNAGETGSSSKDSTSQVPSSSRSLRTSARTLPQLPSAPNMKPAPPPAMYWSRAPVHGSVPRRSFRAHTANLCDEVLWMFGGCDNKGCFRDLWCFDTETMCWSKPRVTGDTPPARRAHSATMVNKRLFVFAGGDGPNYFNDLYIFDTVSLRWSQPEVWGTPPSPRRAHTCNYHEGQLIVFGGGNGVGALNDVHTLDISDLSKLEWRRMDCRGKIPIGRGYHTANLVDGKLIVIGGSDGHMSFNDIHILRLDTRTWYQVKTDEIHNRLGHTATQVGSYLFIFGGHDSKTYTSELLTLNLVNLQWEPRRVCGKKPPGRGYHQAWLRDSRLFIHGGFDGKEIFDDLHFLDLAACAYLPQITSFSVDLDDE